MSPFGCSGVVSSGKSLPWTLFRSARQYLIFNVDGILTAATCISIADIVQYPKENLSIRLASTKPRLRQKRIIAAKFDEIARNF